jgi:hypothetical protein
MRLYHPNPLDCVFDKLLFGIRRARGWGWGLAILFFLAGCIAPEVKQGQITVTLTVDGESKQLQVPAGSTVEDALAAAGIIPGSLDRAVPPFYTVLVEGSNVRLIRVQEEFTVEQVVIPFENQLVRNESLPAGDQYWLQLGKNGLQEVTTRRVYEDGEEVSSSVVKSVVVEPAVPQIKMVGVQKPFAPFPIPGRLAYLLEGNAWVMEETTGNRRQVVNAGDLDGRVFSLSPDGSWLLFTRRGEDQDTINTLWAAKVNDDSALLVDLEVKNVVHFAGWRPGSVLTVAFSTVEPRLAAPGWQANNDLGLLSFSSSGFIRRLPDILEPNSGGLYGWWGTSFAWAPDGLSLAYVRPDGMGLVDLQSGQTAPLLEITPPQTFGDWAWVPGVAWGPDGKILYTEDHPAPAESQVFDLTATSLAGGDPLALVPQVGMFAYPTPSALQQLPSGEAAYQIAYLQAIFPTQSETSRYRLVVMDRDGSNRKTLFPEEGAGLEPQTVAWSPEPLDGRSGYALAVLYQDNLWLVDASSGAAWQITGDGLTTRVDWR